MAREGRELELLIAHLEECLSKSEIKITSPDRIEDKITGEKREVDVSLRATVGSHDVLIILECRDRKNIGDSTWIEQLATKRDDLGANKAIAVSSSGFTTGAVKKARSKNIELRMLEELTADNIRDWFPIKTLKNRSVSLEIAAKVDLRNPRDQKKVENFIKKLKDEEIFHKTIILDHDSTTTISISELIYDKHEPEIEQFNKAGNYILIKEGILYPKNRTIGYKLLINKKGVVIDQIKYTTKFNITVIESPIQSIKSYKSNDERFADIIRFGSSPPLNPGQSFEITGIPDGKGRKIGIRIVDEQSNNREKINFVDL